MGHILIAEDDANMSALLTAYLERDGFRVVACRDGREALRRARSDPPQLVILDIMLPEIDGWEVCRQLRREGSVPIIMLTARIDEADRIAGLRLGADDYVVKPFSPAEVVERVKAVLRRSDGNASNAGAVLTFDGLVLSSERYTLSLDGTAIAVTLSEFRILEALMRAPGRVFSREQLLDVIGESEAGVIDRAIDVHIVNLRKKLGAARQQYIETVRGVGYRLKARQQT
jgi:DNA-binding response OmpR family regulator